MDVKVQLQDENQALEITHSVECVVPFVCVGWQLWALQHMYTPARGLGGAPSLKGVNNQE